MFRAQVARVSTITKAALLVVLLSVALSLTSCAPHPPRVTLGDVVDLEVVRPADTSDYPLPSF